MYLLFIVDDYLYFISTEKKSIACFDLKSIIYNIFFASLVPLRRNKTIEPIFN